MFVLLGLFAVGCYESHSEQRDGAADSGMGPDSDLDSGLTEAGWMDTGLQFRSCRAGEPFPDCYCWIEDSRTDPNGRCITPISEPNAENCVVGNGCATRQWLCTDLGNGALHGRSEYGICIPIAACEWLHSFASRALCFYEDGTFFDTGELASDPCRDDERGVLCGPGCGGCAAGWSCVGVSERSGLGICAQGLPSTSISRCHVDSRPGCPIGSACLGFVLPADVTTVRPEQVWHSCVPVGMCGALASRYPDRFRCPD
ncbi:MAG: hypothetical protein M5U28_39430 [Sandaracinaceae bacterium]|nr:hypothetical protein [Sandaracinaceae bacterium]